MPKTPAQLDREILEARFERLAKLAVKWARPHEPFAAHSDLRPYMKGVPKDRIGEPIDRQFWLGEVLDNIHHEAERELDRGMLFRYERFVEEQLLR